MSWWKTSLLDRVAELRQREGQVFLVLALVIGLKMIGADLAVLNRKLDGQLRWECDEQGGLGFPFPEAFEKG